MICLELPVWPSWTRSWRESGTRRKLAQLRDPRIRATKETIMKSLVGDYRQEHLFALRQSLRCYRHYQELMQEVDVQVKQMMQRLPSKVADGEKPPNGSKSRKTPWRNEPPQLRHDLYRAFGVDLTEVPGINSLTAQMLLTEIGPDLFRFPTAAAFCSWLRLCPDRRSAVVKSYPHGRVPPKIGQPSHCEWLLKDYTEATHS